MGLRLSGEGRGEPARMGRLAIKDGKGKGGKGEKAKRRRLTAFRGRRSFLTLAIQSIVNLSRDPNKFLG